MILLLSCYELGHQPLSLALPLGALRKAGLSARAVDLHVEPFPVDEARNADMIAIAVPMHTALRLGVRAARRARQLNRDAHICFYGLYAWMNRDYLLAERIADSVIAGEYESPLNELARALERGDRLPERIPGVTTRDAVSDPHLARIEFPVPERDPLPAIGNYARFTQNGTAHLAGYTETSRGCLHECRHCPVVPVYGGRFFVLPFDTIMADIRQQVEAGARHITFGDPDFLNGPGHALRVARALHDAYPHLTFDFTTKVEHILEKRYLFPEFAELGAAFIISAFESVSDAVLARLEKGHTAADLDTALEILNDAGIPVQPTWVPFTPWTSLNDYLDMLDWIRTRGLIPHVPVVQLSIRLLVPPGSALLTNPDFDFGPLDPVNFTHCWDHPNPRVDALQGKVAALAERLSDVDTADPYQTFAEVEKSAYEAAGRQPPAWVPPERIPPPPPRLTEDWFC